MNYMEAALISFLVGLLGGMSSHSVWQIRLVRKRVESNELMSNARTAVKSRLALFAITTFVGGVGGFIAGTIAYNRDLHIGTLVAMAFTAGFAVDASISRYSRLPVG